MAEPVNFWILLFVRLKYAVMVCIIGAIDVIQNSFYRSSKKLELKSKPDHVAIVTGGARGIGFHVVKLLLECDMHVVIGCRNVKNGVEAISEIRKSGVSKGEASVIKLDLISLKSVKKFADQFYQKHTHLNVLVNNAGIGIGPFPSNKSADGHEITLAVNYLSHFLLTQLMLPALKRAEGMFITNPRVVHVTSCLHAALPNLELDDLDLRRYYSKHRAYSQSKLCQVMFSKVLARKLKETSSRIQTIAVHPGVVDTEIFNDTTVKVWTPWILRLFFKTPEEGAISIAYCCVSDETENASGLYYVHCMKYPNHKYADNLFIQDKLYEISTTFVKEFL